jgi:hypothetical protein
MPGRRLLAQLVLPPSGLGSRRTVCGYISRGACRSHVLRRIRRASRHGYDRRETRRVNMRSVCSCLSTVVLLLLDIGWSLETSAIKMAFGLAGKPQSIRESSHNRPTSRLTELRRGRGRTDPSEAAAAEACHRIPGLYHLEIVGEWIVQERPVKDVRELCPKTQAISFLHLCGPGSCSPASGADTDNRYNTQRRC